jgi:hypothetical protein
MMDQNILKQKLIQGLRSQYNRRNSVLFWTGFLMGSPFSAMAAYTEDAVKDLNTFFKTGVYERNAFKLSELPSQKALTNEPWSGSYWPDRNLGINNAFRDGSSPRSGLRTRLTHYTNNRDRYYSERKPQYSSLANWTSEQLSKNLSPSEKYDLLMGDTDFTLTTQIMKDLEFRYKNKWSNVTQQWVPIEGFTSWTGICHGWSLASFKTPRPETSVVMVGQKGHIIEFLPEDVKALSAYLYAQSAVQANQDMIGSRCKEKKPKRDKLGRPVTPSCRDVDPGVFHSAILNKIAINDDGFVLNRKNNSMVYNQPVFAYNLKYFNPNTGEDVATLRDGLVERFSYDDIFSDFRNKETRRIVGVEMTVTWKRETQEVSDIDNTNEADKNKEQTYLYDLELDANGNILGGEYRNHKSNKRGGIFKGKLPDQPGFIWGLPKDVQAWSYGSIDAEDTIFDANGNQIPAWDGRGQMPESWFKAHLKSAEMRQPLAEVVYQLVEFSRRK